MTDGFHLKKIIRVAQTLDFFFFNLDYVTEKYIDIVSEKAHIKEPLVTVYKLWHISGTFTSLSVTLCLCSFNDNFGLFRPSLDNLTLRYKQLRAPKHQLPLAVTASNDRLQNQLVQRLNIQ